MVIVNTEDSRNKAWAKDKSGFGHRMLTKMGWTDGKGLGKDEQGMNLNLRGVRRTEETLGIGANTDTHGSEGWEKTNKNFHDVLATLRVHHSETLSKKEKKRRKKKNDKKSKKDKSSHNESVHDSNRSGSSSNGNVSGLILPQNKVTAGHAKKMRDAKDLTNKSDSDMAAIFGFTPQQFQFQKIGAINSNSSKERRKKSSKKAKQDESHIVSDASDGDDCTKKQKEMEKKKEKKRKRADKEEKKKKKSRRS